MLIRTATAADWPAIWPFFRQIVAAGDTFTYDPAMGSAAAREMWLGPPGRAVVAVGDDGAVLGTADMHPNREGPGAHVASASFMVASRYAGRGVGRALVEDALAWARREGFRAMQFNAVAATNTRALALYRALGFQVVGRVPAAFLHPDRGYVDLLVLHRLL